MIVGLLVTVGGEELLKMCLSYADSLKERADKADKFMADVGVNDRDAEGGGGSNVVTVLQQAKQRAEQLRDEEAEIRFIAAHLVKTETYQLGRDELRRLGIVKGHRY